MFELSTFNQPKLIVLDYKEIYSDIYIYIIHAYTCIVDLYVYIYICIYIYILTSPPMIANEGFTVSFRMAHL